MWKFDRFMLDGDMCGSSTASCRTVTGVEVWQPHVGR